MINLIASYYENIGPFKETSCSLFFDEWKYLIKAPIWSWKSFLFFDAPRYALYKDSSRNMLNLQCKNGEISLIFDVDGSYYLIKRILKATKMWNDSCSSQLFTISYKWDNLLKDIKKLAWNMEILQWWENIIEKFESKDNKQWSIEEISFKNETDIQTSLESLLPPKEVFLSTVFLLQDADNIFEMRPADRLIVLKNVFNLLWIDDAKEKVQEKKKEVQYKLKALQDHSLEDWKLRSNLRWLWDKIKYLETDVELNEVLSWNNSFFQDIEWFFDKISLNNFSLNWFDKSCFQEAEDVVKKKVDEVIKLDAQLNEYNQQLRDLDQQKSKILNDISDLKINISNLEKKIENIDVKKWNELKEKKISLYKDWEELDKNADYSKFSEFINFWNKSIEENDDSTSLELPNNLKTAFDIIQIWKNSWIELKSKIDIEKTKLENIELQEKNRKENNDREIDKLKDLKSRKEEEIKIQQDRIKELDKIRDESADFDCPDICKKCPYINAINKQQYEQYSQQKEKLNQNLNELKIGFESQHFDERIKELENEKYPEWEDYKKELQQKIESRVELSNSLKDYLLSIWFSDWEKSYHNRESIQNEIQTTDKQLLLWEEESRNIDKYNQEKIVSETSLKHLDESLQNNNKQIDDLNIKVDDLKWYKEKIDSEKLQQQQNDIKQIFQYIWLLEQLIQDNVSNQNLTKQLQEDEKKLTRLYSILWKEIVLFALDDYLPILSGIINNYLSQCVDYTIQMKIIENNEKLELDAKVLDSKWEREVKSLSWWQRTILKLVRMLAISSYLHTPLLFLDETINNLDIDTVWKVSEMIDNFVKQRTMKFYTVTHNKEIQDMQIWDDVIELNKIEESK